MVIEEIIQFLYKKKINTLVVHGLKTSNHTHRYIHESIYNTFLHIASNFPHYTIQVNWYNDDVCSPNNYNTNDKYLIFSTPHIETDIHLPILDNAYYILHYRKCKVYSDIPIVKYDHLLQTKRAVKYVEFRHSPDHINCIDGVIKIEGTPFWFDSESNEMNIAWATNLFPTDINKNIEKIRKSKSPLFTLKSYFCGSIWRANQVEIDYWVKLCESHNIDCIMDRQTDENVHQKCVMDSYLAHSIQGKSQRQTSNKYYIPCRIFKNISYGAIPITNNIGVYNMLKDFRVIYDDDLDKLMEKALGRYDEIQNNYEEYKHEQIRIMEYVRDHHTYLNRIATCIQYGFY